MNPHALLALCGFKIAQGLCLLSVFDGFGGTDFFDFGLLLAVIEAPGEL